MESKAGAVVAFSESLQSFADRCKAEEKRIADKRKFVENRVAQMRDYLHRCMDVAGVMEIEVGTKTAKITKNPHKVVIEDGDLLPAKFKVIQQTTSIDKAGIKDALKAGEEVSGATLEQGFSLRIK